MKHSTSFGFVAAMTLAAAFISACSSGVSTTEAALVPAQPFCDGAILAKGKPVHVFGTGDGCITVRLAGKKARTQAADGQWDAVLPAMKAGGPYRMTIASKAGKTIINDIYVGNVIMVAGQSNMQFKLEESSTPQEEWEGDPLLRSYSLPRMEEGEPWSPEDGWVACTDTNAGRWSAIGYHIGKLLRERTGEATAIINCYQGASIIEAWMPKEVATRPDLVLPDELTHIDHRWGYEFNFPGLLYDFTLSRIFPYTLNEVVWYQGESNTGTEEYTVYPALAAEMVKSWRSAFEDPALPFIMVQIADYDYRQDDAWKKFQEAQLTIPDLVDGVTVVPCADVCESASIHPKTKSKLAARIVDTILQ